MNILVVEDDPLLADGMCSALRLAGHDVWGADTAARAIDDLAARMVDLVLLDLGLPDQDGMNVLRFIRENHEGVFVIILTARDGLRDRINGLDAGADDYLVKPVALTELEARLRALERRWQGADVRLVLGGLVMDKARHEVKLDGTPVPLTPREWRLLEILLEQVGELLHKDRLLNLLGGWDGDMSPNAVEVVISRLRAKLEPGVRIRTVRGYGYLLENPDAEG